jgi:starch-binding outer membrane protein, SusD/RagB family
LVTKARIFVDLGQFSNASVLAAQVPTSYQYTLTFSTASGLNGNWSLNTSQSAYSVSDSVDASGLLKNATPFVSAKDVRVPTTNANKTGIDGTTPLFTTSIWANTGQIPVVSGVDARLIDAEAKLSANDIPGMMSILNALRTTAQTLGTFRPAVLAALPTPATQAAATTVFFREKAFWTFGRGQRLGDLRRMIRQYKLSADQVLPTGTYYKGGSYGADVNFPVPDVERANPQFAGCLDRNA